MHQTDMIDPYHLFSGVVIRGSA